MFDDYLDTALGLAIVLYIEENPVVREIVVERLSPKAKNVLEVCTERVRKSLASLSEGNTANGDRR